MPTQKFTQQDVDQLSTWFQRRKETQFAWTHTISERMTLPATRAFWPMSSVAYTNPQGLDVSGNANHLTNNNSSTFGYANLIPYVATDGINQYLSKADGGAANWADIIGTEAYILAAERGLTIHGWFLLTSVAANVGIVNKGTTVAAASSYELFNVAGGTLSFRVSTGAAYVGVSPATLIVANTWYHIVCRYIPATSISIFLNGTKATTVAGIPAALPDSAAQFTVGAFSTPASYMPGRSTMVSLCAAQHSDVMIAAEFAQERVLFGV